MKSNCDKNERSCGKCGGRVQTAAAVAAQALLHSGDARRYKTKQAPGPDDVNWSALWCSSDERLGRRMLSGLVYFVIMLIPLGAFAGILSVVRSPSSLPPAQLACNLNLPRAAAALLPWTHATARQKHRYNIKRKTCSCAVLCSLHLWSCQAWPGRPTTLVSCFRFRCFDDLSARAIFARGCHVLASLQRWGVSAALSSHLRLGGGH